LKVRTPLELGHKVILADSAHLIKQYEMLNWELGARSAHRKSQ
jgi:hypothetical protein